MLHTRTPAPLHEREAERNEIVRRLKVVDTEDDPMFDHLTRAAQLALKKSMCVVSLLELNRSWFKSCVGLQGKEVPRGDSFCSFAVLISGEDCIFEIPDTLLDERFLLNPLVTGAPFVRFYAAWIIVLKGLPVGTFCVLDDKPGVLTAEERNILAEFGKAVRQALLIRQDSIEQLEKLEETRRAEELVRLELQVAKKRLEESVDVLCHEIRNPLNGIHGSKQIMQEQFAQMRKSMDRSDERPSWYDTFNSTAKEMKEMLQAISTSSDHLKDIVDNVLVVSSAQNTKTMLNMTSFSARAVAEKVALMFKAKASAKSVLLKLQAPFEDDIVWALGDPHKIAQLLINFTSNSLKFTDKGEINIILSQQIEGDSVRFNFEVRDTGIGMTPEEISKLFQRFTQANPGIASKYGGSGLGLNICAQLSQLMGGEIHIESQNNETSVHFSLRCSITMKPEPRLQHRDAKRRRTDTTPKIDSECLQKKRVLVVEDNRVNRMLLQRMLVTEGYTVFMAEDGKVAVESVSNSLSQYDAILMDIEMPIMNGIEATKHIRDMEKSKNIGRTRIIGVSASVRCAEEWVNDSDMDGYVRKPFQKEDIISALEDWQMKVKENMVIHTLKPMYNIE